MSDVTKIITHKLCAFNSDSKFIAIDVQSVSSDKVYHFEFSVPENCKYSAGVKFRKKGLKSYEENLKSLISEASDLGFCNAHLIAGSLRRMAFNFKFDVGPYNDIAIFFEAPDYEDYDAEQKKLLAENPGKKILWAQFVESFQS